jgi:hypothetical protein
MCDDAVKDAISVGISADGERTLNWYALIAWRTVGRLRLLTPTLINEKSEMKYASFQYASRQHIIDQSVQAVIAC